MASLLSALYAIAQPALFRLDPEDAHALTVSILGAIAPILAIRGGPIQKNPIDVMGLHFPNRVGLAAGMDKNARALSGWAALGFGHVEIGTVTPSAQSGSSRPRIWREPELQALVNNMGFPNDGVTNVRPHLWDRPKGLIIGANIGPNLATMLGSSSWSVGDDYYSLTAWLNKTVNYFTINISSPNTPGLQNLQTPKSIAQIIGVVRSATNNPILVKLSPDLPDDALPDLVSAVIVAGASGIIAANTTKNHSRLSGGLSGKPLAMRAHRMTEQLANLAGDKLAIISVGGIFTPQDVHDRLAAGASLIQIYTSLVYDGPGLVRQLAEAI